LTPETENLFDAAMIGRMKRSYFAGWPIREEYLIVDGGKLAGIGAQLLH
jgi:hypothetical protein